MKITIDPLTRVSGLLSIEVYVENNKITDAKVTGNQFRGFEKMFKDRNPFDVLRLAPRICGICSTHHEMAAVIALEHAMNITPDLNGVIARDIVNGFEFIQNYLRHIYFFVFPDYVEITKVNPLFKLKTAQEADYRLNLEETKKINKDYEDAVRFSRDAHKAIAILAGKAPHPHGIWIGGITTDINIQQIEKVKYLLLKINEFISGRLIEDVETIAAKYEDYYNLGRGYGNLMCYNLFSNYEAPIKYTTPSVMINGVKEVFNDKDIVESIITTWQEPTNEKIIPGGDYNIYPNASKAGAYTWINAPRYKGNAMEVGALARMILSGNYNRGISTMDRIRAKAYEAQKVCNILNELLARLKIQKPQQKAWQVPVSGEGMELIEAERGGLGHWLAIENKRIKNYTILPPSTWNMSPTDQQGVKGTVEKALIGTEINNIKEPVEVGRIVRSFDPCLNCAAHIISDRYEPLSIEIL